MIAKLRLAQVKTVSLFYLHLNISRVSLCAVMLRVSQINYDFILYIYSFTSTEKTKENQHDDHQVETLPTTAVKRLRQHPILSTSLFQVSTSKNNKASRNFSVDDSDNESFLGVITNEMVSQEINGIENLFFQCV
jgi:hypothetical protein